MNKRIIKVVGMLLLIAFVIIIATAFTGCSVDSDKDNGKLNIITTIYAPYDFVKEVAGDKVNLTMLLNPGEETHSFDPSPKDIIAISNCDLFIYNGGENDAWIDDILDSLEGVKTLRMMDYANELYLEEDEPEYDEHVWTSPKNAINIVEAIAQALGELDNNNKEGYNKECAIYTEKLKMLDEEFAQIVDGAKRKDIVFADRFALRYFTEEYGLSYKAAFPGCAADNDINPGTIVRLMEEIKDDDVPVIMKSEMSSGVIAEAISEETGAEIYTFYSCHNVSRDDFSNGIGYLKMMEHNKEVLKEALN